MSTIVHQVPYFPGQQDGQVFPITDRRWIHFADMNQSGVVNGCHVTNPSLNNLAIASGWGIACGCIFTVSSETVVANVASSGTQLGELILQVDTNTSTGTWITTAVDSSTPLTQDDLTAADGVYEILFATYQIDTSGNITDLQEEFPTVDPMTVQPFNLGIDNNGNYGYYKTGENTVTPFDPWDIVVPAGYALTSNSGVVQISGNSVAAGSAYGSYIIANVGGLGYTSASRTNGQGAMKTIEYDGTNTSQATASISLNSSTKWVIAHRTASSQAVLSLSFS